MGSFAELDLVDRVSGADRGVKVSLVDFVRGVSVFDCGILSCVLESSVCTESADCVTGDDRFDPEDVLSGHIASKLWPGSTEKRLLTPESAWMGDQNCCRFGDVCCPKHWR